MRDMIIGICGGTGSGKTTVARRIYEVIGGDQAVYLQHDAYYRDFGGLPPEERARINFDHPDALDNDLFINHLRLLIKGESIYQPVYDFTTHSRRPETIKVDPKPIIIIEGILIFANAELRSLMDLKIYVDTADDIRLIRRIERDVTERGRTVASVIKQYLETVRPMHLQFVEPSKRYADVIIPEGGFNTVGIDLIIGRIKMQLAQQAAIDRC